MGPILLASATLALFLYMITPAVDSKRWPLAIDLSRNSFMFAALGLVILALVFHQRPELIPIIVLMVMVHEYGHVLAFRLAGHPRPVFRLAPFGGVAFSDRRSRSQTENAFIAMMGPGFSIALVVGGLLAALVLMPAEVNLAWSQSRMDWVLAADRELSVEPWRITAIWIALTIVKWTAFLNFLNLLPFYPLDGGRTVRSMASVFGTPFASRLIYALTILFGLIGLLRGNLFLLLIAVVGLAAAKQEEPLDRVLRDISRRDALLVAGAYASMLAFFGYLSLPLLMRFVPSLPALGLG